MKYKVGDVVKTKEGYIMTIVSVDPGFFFPYRMKEGSLAVGWNDDMIVGLASENEIAEAKYKELRENMKVKIVLDCHCGTQPTLRGSSTNDKYVTNYWFCCPKCGMRNKESGNQFDPDPEEKAMTQWNEMILEHRGKMYARFKSLEKEYQQ